MVPLSSSFVCVKGEGGRRYETDITIWRGSYWNVNTTPVPSANITWVLSGSENIIQLSLINQSLYYIFPLELGVSSFAPHETETEEGAEEDT